MMTKRLPQLGGAQAQGGGTSGPAAMAVGAAAHAPRGSHQYKYQELRGRRPRGGGEATAIAGPTASKVRATGGGAAGEGGTPEGAGSGQDEYRQRAALHRERSTLATARSNTHLGAGGASGAGGGGGAGTGLPPVSYTRQHSIHIHPHYSSRLHPTGALSTSKENLARSNTNLGASRDSLDEAGRIKPVATGSRETLDVLKEDINKRQASMDHFNKKSDQNNKTVYTFTLSKTDRSKSEPVLFPPLPDKQNTTVAAVAATQDAQKGPHAPQPSSNHTQSVDKREERGENKENNVKLLNNVKFPIVSRYDLYKHLGISTMHRKRKVDKRDYGRPGAAGKPPLAQNNNHHHYKNATPSHPLAENSGRSRNTSALQSTRPDHAPQPQVQPQQVPSKKLEMYKQWHEKQVAARHKSRDYDTQEAARLANLYRERYEGEDELRLRLHERLPTRHRRGDTTLPKIGLKDRGHVVAAGAGAVGGAESQVPEGGQTDRSRAARDTSLGAASRLAMAARAESPPAPIHEDLLRRTYTARTWRTWRHHDESYAYDDVDEYIAENELMDEEKIVHIKEWIMAVARAQLDPNDDSDEDTQPPGEQDDVGTLPGSYNDQTDKSIPDSTRH